MLIKLAEVLEMDSSKYPLASSNSGIKMLHDWSANMKQHGIDREFQRFHLVHHLHSIGMISTANEYVNYRLQIMQVNLFIMHTDNLFTVCHSVGP